MRSATSLTIGNESASRRPPLRKFGIMPMARRLGDYLGLEPIPAIEPISGPYRPRAGNWPPEVWAEMQAIYATPDPVPGTATAIGEAPPATDDAATSVANRGDVR